GLHAGINIPLVLRSCVLLFAANAGLGIAGASLFCLLEVKSRQDPITWAYRYLVLPVRGLDVPLAVPPSWLRAIGGVPPQTYGLGAVRALVRGGAEAYVVAGSLFGLRVTSALARVAGFSMLTWALRPAERGGGIGVVA